MDVRSRKQTKSMSALEVLTGFINSVDDDAGWWYNAGNNNIKDKDFEYLFPSLSTVFGLYKDAFNIFFLEANLIKKRGNKLVISMKGYDDLKNVVNNHVSVETLKCKVGKFKPVNSLKSGHASLTPMKIWDQNARKTCPPTKLASREVTRCACNTVMHVMKNSEHFVNVVKLCLSNNELKCRKTIEMPKLDSE